ncbi:MULTISPECIES: hypothetical protein [Morganellaceae]|uniref:Uncharacterized protein n=1 Tax=Morganella psychrotolerans TaxID=368603 RepID=A0A1B8HCY1_9GAMM|nr:MULTISPECIES: hypothetical protein [Morganellaceae]OBU06939.1 hypothetical protein AYY17_19565 [Morganella psychrotolerans]
MLAILIGVVTVMTLSLLLLCGLYAKYQYHETNKLPGLRSPVVVCLSLAVKYVGLFGLILTVSAAFQGSFQIPVAGLFVLIAFGLHAGLGAVCTFERNRQLR